LAVFYVVHNLAEGVFSVDFGLQDEALTLFGFGIDSFVEALSGLGIFAMVLRIRQHPEAEKTRFERTALRVTGIILPPGSGTGRHSHLQPGNGS
jgi:hypothetical protein